MNSIQRISATALAIVLLTSFSANAASKDKGFVSLFDGKTLKGWVTADGGPVTNGWMVKDDCIHLSPEAAKHDGNIFATGEYANFILEFDWKLDHGGNNGVKYRVKKYEKGGWLGPEYQLIDDGVHKDGNDPQRQTASVYALFKPEGKKLKPIGQFNNTRIVVKGSKIEHWLNGKKVISADTASPLWKERVAASKFAKYHSFGENPSGRIMLTDHHDAVWFKNIRIKRLK